jgi:hypothetical protein
MWKMLEYTQGFQGEKPYDFIYHSSACGSLTSNVSPLPNFVGWHEHNEPKPMGEMDEHDY